MGVDVGVDDAMQLTEITSKTYSVINFRTCGDEYDMAFYLLRFMCLLLAALRSQYTADDS